jgi:hypothetical protein
MIVSTLFTSVTQYPDTRDMSSAKHHDEHLRKIQQERVRMGRRQFLTMGGSAAVATGLSLGGQFQPAAAVVDSTPSSLLSGTDLSGWETELGDGLYTAPGQAPVNVADIATIHSGSLSTLRANVARRGVMAHNITFKRQIDATCFGTVHVVQYAFRLPYMPATNAWPDNAQTVEGGFFVWDGPSTRLDYGLAFQWILNPWMPTFGAIRTWTGSRWSNTGFLTVDTNWHTVTMTFDPHHSSTAMSIDSTPIPAALTTTPKDGWGTEIAARLQAEMISLWPGSRQTAPSHRLEVRDWTWARYPYLAEI